MRSEPCCRASGTRADTDSRVLQQTKLEHPAKVVCLVESQDPESDEARITGAAEPQCKVELHYQRGGVVAMAVLSVTSRGQVTFRREVLDHLGIKPGDKIEIDLLPGGRAQLSAARPRASVSRLSGLLAGKTNDATLTINEIEDAIARAGAAAGLGEQ